MNPTRLKARDPGVAADIQRVLAASYRVEASLLGVAAEAFPPLQRTTEEIRDSPNRLFGTAVDGILAAVAEVSGGGDVVDLSALVVHPDFFRRGLAKHLVRYLLNDAFAGRTFTVSTGAVNKPALALYKRLGFHIERRWRQGEGIEMVGMTRRPG